MMPDKGSFSRGASTAPESPEIMMLELEAKGTELQSQRKSGKGLGLLRFGMHGETTTWKANADCGLIVSYCDAQMLRA